MDARWGPTVFRGLALCCEAGRVEGGWPIAVNFDLRSGIAVLERTPHVLEALLSGLAEEWTAGNEGAESWSPFDVVGHLIDGELTDWMARLRIILRQGPNRRFEPFDRFRHIGRNKGRTLRDLLAEFRHLREQNLGELRALTSRRPSSSSPASIRRSAASRWSSSWQPGSRMRSSNAATKTRNHEEHPR